MNKIIIILCILCYNKLSAQFTIVPTGTTKMLNTISVIGKNILISSPQHYMVQSYDECKTITQVYQPGPYWNWLMRKDSSTYYLFSSDLFAQESILYKTYNGGHTWKTQLDSMNFFVQVPVFFDTLHGRISGISTGGIQTYNGGKTWSSLSSFFNYTSFAKTYGDSLFCLGGSAGGIGGISISNNRGRTWFNYGANFGQQAEPTDVGFVNKDTILATSLIGDNHANYGITYNGGQTWSYITNIPWHHTLQSICIKSSSEYYIVGATNATVGIVWKSTDFGKSWSSFNTNIQTTLMQMAVLNDSIALLSGTNGVLLRWNYKQTIFTGLKENEKEQLDIKIFPNPSKNKLSFTGGNIANSTFSLIICNMIGQVLLSKEAFKLEDEIDISYLQDGIYYLKIQNDGGQKICKFLKE